MDRATVQRPPYFLLVNHEHNRVSRQKEHVDEASNAGVVTGPRTNTEILA